MSQKINKQNSLNTHTYKKLSQSMISYDTIKRLRRMSLQTQNCLFRKDIIRLNLRDETLEYKKMNDLQFPIESTNITPFNGLQITSKSPAKINSTINSSINASKDFKGMVSKCVKLNIDPLHLIKNNQLHLGKGRVTYIHQFKGIGQIKLDGGDFVRFHRIDFRGDWWLVTVAFVLGIPMSFLYSSHPVTNHKDSKELFLVDHSFFKELKIAVQKYGIKKSNYYELLQQKTPLPQVMNKFLHIKKSTNQFKVNTNIKDC